VQEPSPTNLVQDSLDGKDGSVIGSDVGESSDSGRLLAGC
jgi:hypothetical protein